MTNVAEKLWADTVKETGIWTEDCADKVASFGRILIPKICTALAEARHEGYLEAVEIEGKL